MILGDLHRQRPFAGAIAIVAMAFYAVLLPWHTVSQATGPLTQSWKITRAALPSALGGGGSCQDPTTSEAADTLSHLQWLYGLPRCSPSAGELLTSQAHGARRCSPHGRRWPCGSHRASASEPRPT
jgi:hypothetical protein